ncbi:unnamed protein product [Arabidopsis halleri]
MKTIAPGSITERRRRLLNGMGLESKKSMLGAISIQRVSEPVAVAGVCSGSRVAEAKVEESDHNSPVNQRVHRSPSMSVLLVRSRSDSDIEASSAEKKRKEEMLGKTSKSRLTRTASAIGAPCARICPYFTQTQASPPDAPNGHQSQGQRSGAFLSSEYGENGMWNRLSDLQTGKQLTMEEFEKSVGYSSVVKDLMRRENANSTIDFRKFNSYVSKSLRVSKKRGAALLKNIKDVAHSMSSSKVSEKEKDSTGSGTSSPKVVEKNNEQANQWVKVRHSGKSHKDLSALHMCQEIQAHQGGIWTMKFSPDSYLLASAGEDCAIHVWEVQECEIMSMSEGSLTPTRK